jgi:large subunit ribosomal protein L25
VSAEVPLHLTGEPVGARDGGVLEQLVFALPIEARPQDIPHEIEADVSHLAIGDQIRLEEVSIPAGVTVTIEPDTLVAQVIAPRVVEEPEPEEEEGVEGEAVEGEEGEAPSAEGAPAEGGGGGGEE